MVEMNKIYVGDCIDVMKSWPENFVDTILTDPPYGIGFMGKGWDTFDPKFLERRTDRYRKGQASDVIIGGHGAKKNCVASAAHAAGEYDRSVEGNRQFQDWCCAWATEALRIAKPGAMMLVSGGTRTFHRMAAGLEDAGWQIRDCLMWLYGSGFPKSHNLHGIFEGYGTALKPAWEPIIVAMKPIDGTFAENAEKWGVAGINVDGGRIESDWANDANKRGYQGNNYVGGSPFAKDSHDDRLKVKREMPTKGRWPANFLLDEEAAAMLDGMSGNVESHGGGQSSFGGRFGNGKPSAQTFHSSGGASRFFYVAKADRAERNEGCEEEIWESEDQGLLMDGLNQHAKDISDDTLRTLVSCSWSIVLSGLTLTAPSLKALTFTISTTIKLITALKISNLSQGSNIKGRIRDAIATIKANGLSLAESAGHIEKLISISTNESMVSALGASLVALKMLSEISGSVRRGNGHPTVKPLSLMKYLCNLTRTPSGGIVLDPFAGSGTTLWAAEFHNRPWLGIEMNPEYVAIANARIANERSQMKMAI